MEICCNIYNYVLRERKDWINSRKCRTNACSLESEYIIPTDTLCPTFASQRQALAAAPKEFPTSQSLSLTLCSKPSNG
ncbi:MAG: hypothetical protein F6K31_25235 [Symploca sp. SIO2G7]|nr:hypothetical protein [Symploca sp. SIO2G7]